MLYISKGSKLISEVVKSFTKHSEGLKCITKNRIAAAALFVNINFEIKYLT